MPAPKGNKFWEARSKSGRDKIFSTPEDLWCAAQEYFKWNEENPLQEEKIFHNQGEITRTTVSKMRAMTKTALCRFLHIDPVTWENYRKGEGYEDFFNISREIESIIYDQKFTGAAAELLSGNIIARELGLADKKEVENTVSVIELKKDFDEDSTS